MAGSEPAPAPMSAPPPGQSSEGFTQLLHALSGNSSPTSAVKQPEVVPRTVVSSNSRLAGMESGFTSLLRTLNRNDGNDRTENLPDSPARSTSAPPSEGVDGFTALLQGLSGTTHSSGERKPNARPIDEDCGFISPSDTPAAHIGAPPAYTSGQAASRTFTQLLSMLAPEAAKTAESGPSRADTLPTCTDNNPVSRPSGEGTSFTRLLSAVGESPSRPSQDDNRPSAMEDFSPRLSPGRADTLGSNQLPTATADWSRATRPQPQFSCGSGGLTQLLRTLDEPAKGPDMPIAYPPVDAPRSNPRKRILIYPDLQNAR